ncbi:hypothetical protein ACJJTC_014293 [Scirpophaga incertulas]
MAERDRIKSRCKKSPSQINLDLYKQHRNTCNKLCRDAKRSYIHNKIESLGQNKVWNFLQSLGVGKHAEVSSSPVDINKLNSHFSTPPIALDLPTKMATLASLKSLPTLDYPPFKFTEVSDDAVRRSGESKEDQGSEEVF